MFYVKPLNFCIKGKTHSLGIAHMVFEFSRSRGSQAGLALRQLGRWKVHICVCLADAIEDSHS